MTTSADLGLRYHKADGRYYVYIDDKQAGWVVKSSKGVWSFYACVRETIRGVCLASGFRTRREAVRYGLATLRIEHLGRVYELEFSPLRDEPVYFEEATLEAIGTALLDEMYPDLDPV